MELTNKIEKLEDELENAHCYRKKFVDEVASYKENFFNNGEFPQIELAIEKVHNCFSFEKQQEVYDNLPICIKNDKEFVINLVKKEPIYLRYVNREFKNDKEIILISVANFGLTLEWASDRLKDDEEVVRTACKENEYAIQYASERLQLLISNEYDYKKN